MVPGQKDGGLSGETLGTERGGHSRPREEPRSKN